MFKIVHNKISLSQDIWINTLDRSKICLKIGKCQNPKKKNIIVWNRQKRNTIWENFVSKLNDQKQNCM